MQVEQLRKSIIKAGRERRNGEEAPVHYGTTRELGRIKFNTSDVTPHLLFNMVVTKEVESSVDIFYCFRSRSIKGEDKHYIKDSFDLDDHSTNNLTRGQIIGLGILEKQEYDCGAKRIDCFKSARWRESL